MRRVRTIYLPLLTLDPDWQEEVVKAVAPHHELVIYDESKPLAEQFAEIEVVLDSGGTVGTHEMMDAAKDARLWQIVGTGLDHVDIAYMKSKGFIVCNCPGMFSAAALAESAMMYILMLAHNYAECGKNFRSSVLYKPMGTELGSKVLGLVGFGVSAQVLARRARSFEMKIHAIDIRQIEEEILSEIQPEFMGSADDLDKVVAEADFLSLHLHLNDETRHIIDARRIAMMKPGACLINVARGALIDEAAMHEALLNGTLGGAGLDVSSIEPADPTLPVYQLPNVIMTPHTSGCTDSCARNRAQVCLENLNRISQDLEPLYRVDE